MRYKSNYKVDLDPDTESIVTMGAKDALAHLLFAGRRDSLAGDRGDAGFHYRRRSLTQWAGWRDSVTGKSFDASGPSASNSTARLPEVMKSGSTNHTPIYDDSKSPWRSAEGTLRVILKQADIDVEHFLEA